MTSILFISMQGSKKSNRALSKLLRQEGFFVTYFFPHKIKTYGNDVQKSDPASSKYERKFHLLVDNSFFYFSIDLLKYILQNKRSYDIVFIDFDAGTLLSLVIRQLLREKKFIYFQIDHKSRFKDFGDIKNQLRSRLRKLFMFGMQKSKDLVLACNHDAVGDFCDAGFKSLFAPLGFDETKFNYLPKKKHNDDLVIGYVSRLSHEKGIFHLINVSGKIKGFQFVIDTSRNKNFEFTSPAADLISSNIRFTEIDFERIERFYADIDYLIVPSIETTKFKEQYGRVVVEAQATGCPVITSDCGMLPILNINKNLIYRNNSDEELITLLQKVKTGQVDVVSGCRLSSINKEKFSDSHVLKLIKGHLNG